MNILLILALLGLSAVFQALPIDFIKLLGILMTFFAIGAFFYNLFISFLAPPLYGLALHLNSGSERVFMCEDTNYLRNAIRTLKEFMENPEKYNYVNIEVGQDVTGNITIGDVYGKVEYKQ